MYNETSKDLVEKINRLFEEDIKVIFCVGEDYERKERGMTKEFVTTEIKEVFDKLDQDKLDNIIIAYEPIWAISNGITPSRTPLNEEIEEVTEVIKKLVYNTYNKELKVLYGGSVNSKNVDELNTISVVDGYLIGGASVKKDEFNYIMERCK
jgi:triosephosphate isomerase